MEDPCSASVKNGESLESPLMTNQRIKNSKPTSPGKKSVLYKGSPIAEDCRNFGEIEQCDNDPLLNCCANAEKLEDQKESTNKIKKALHDKLRKNQTVHGHQDVLLNETSVTTSDSISSNSYSPGGVPVLETCELQPISVSTNSPTGSYSEEQTALQESVAMSLGMPMACAASTHSNSISPLDINMHHTAEQCYPGMVDLRPTQILAGQSEQDLLHNTGIHHQTIRQNSYSASNQCHSSNYSNNGYIYPITPPQMNHSPPNNEIMERYLQQQQQQQQQQQPYHPEQSPGYGFYGVSMKDNYAMKSPDSGYQEPCLSPTEQMNIVRLLLVLNTYTYLHGLVAGRYASLLFSLLSSCIHFKFHIKKSGFKTINSSKKYDNFYLRFTKRRCQKKSLIH
jgi:hypothetical protein